MERSNQEEGEIMVSDLEYISANIVEQPPNDTGPDGNALKKTSKQLASNYQHQFDLDSSSLSSESSNDEVVIPAVQGRLHQPTDCGFNTLKTIPSNSTNTTINLEDGEVSSEGDQEPDADFLEAGIDESQIKQVQLRPGVAIACFGSVLNVLENTMVAKAIPSAQLLDVGTSVFLSDRSHIGEIYDLFGRIECPFYSIVVKRTALPLLREGVFLFFADTPNTVRFVEFDKINKIDEHNDSDSEQNDKSTHNSAKPLSHQRKRQNQKRNHHQDPKPSHSTHLNAWPPSMKMLKTSYDVRTFYKYGQWPSVPPNDEPRRKFAFSRQKNPPQ